MPAKGLTAKQMVIIKNHLNKVFASEKHNSVSGGATGCGGSITLIGGYTGSGGGVWLPKYIAHHYNSVLL